MKEKPKRSTKPRSQVDPEVSELLAGLDRLFQQAQEVEQRYTVACQQLQRSVRDEHIKAYHGVVGEQRELQAQIEALVPVLRSVLAATVFRRPSLRPSWAEFDRAVEGLLEPEPELEAVLTDMRSVLLAVQAAGRQVVSQPPAAPRLASDRDNGQPRSAIETCTDPVEHGAGVTAKPRLLTVEQAAAYLARTKEAVEHMIASGKLPRVRADRRVFLDVLDLDSWISENKA